MERIGCIRVVSVLVTLLLVAGGLTPAEAQRGRLRSGKVACGGVHGVRAFVLGNPTEMIDSSYAIRNVNLASGADVTITRLTVRDFFGNVVDDFGEAADVPREIPRNLDIPAADPPAVGFDITTVPAGASHYLTTSHVYGHRFLAPTQGGVSPTGAGNGMLVVIEFTTAGDPDLVLVSGTLRTRQLLNGFNGQQHEERARQPLACLRLRATSGD